MLQVTTRKTTYLSKLMLKLLQTNVFIITKNSAKTF